MEAIGVIPARYSSTRFAGKIMADLCGKPMIQHVWERAKKALLLDDVIIACDEEMVFFLIDPDSGLCHLPDYTGQAKQFSIPEESK